MWNALTISESLQSISRDRIAIRMWDAWAPAGHFPGGCIKIIYFPGGCIHNATHFCICSFTVSWSIRAETYRSMSWGVETKRFWVNFCGFILNLVQLVQAPEARAKILGEFSFQTPYDVIIFKFQGGASAPPCRRPWWDGLELSSTRLRLSPTAKWI